MSYLHEVRSYLVDRLTATPIEHGIRRLNLAVFGRRMSRLERRNREYDYLTVKIIKRVMSRASNSVDAGAHRGYFLRHLVRAAPGGTHYAFEPIPELAESLRRIRGATVFAAALSDSEGSATFHFMPTKAAQSSLHARPDREEGQQVVNLSVPVHRLDSIWPQETPLTLLKIDVENAEVELLRGATATLSRWHPVVVFECGPETLPEATEVLTSVGLHPYLIDDFLEGTRRPVGEVHKRALDDGEWFFAAGPAS